MSLPSSKGTIVSLSLLSLSTPLVSGQDTSVLRDAVTLDGVRTHQLALQDIADANGGRRVSGTPGYDASAMYVASLLTAAGYSVVVQSFGYHAWIPLGPSTLEQTAPGSVPYIEGFDYRLMTETNAGDVVAPVTPVDLNLIDPASTTSGCNAADFIGFPPGNIALIQRGVCTFQLKAELAAAAGASGVIIMNQGNTPERTGLLLGTLTEAYSGGIPVMFTTFDRGVEWAGTPGLTMHMTADVFRGSATSSNVIAETSGGDPGRVVMAAAGLDSPVSGPGINGNGSGASAILEIALQMASLGITTNNRVRFAFWGATNSGNRGSAHYVGALTAGELDAIDMVLSFEAIGSPNFARFIYDGDGSDGGPVGGIGSSDIESTFRDYYTDPLLGGGLASEPTPSIGRGAQDFLGFGIPVGGLFGGLFDIKTPDQVALYGGSAGDQFDPCANLACDTFDNVSFAGLEQMSDAAAHAILAYGLSTAGLRIAAVGDLVGDVEALGIPHGVENGLLAKLEAALRAIDEGRDDTAINLLEAFINQVEAKRGTQFTDAEADALIGAALSIIADLT